MKSERYVSLSPPRQLIRDLIYFGKKSHTVGINATLNVAALAKERRQHSPPIGWAALMVKAMALVCRDTPALRRAFLPFPWAHLYQHPYTVASIVIERGWRGESGVFFDQIHRPETLSLQEIDQQIRGMKFAPVERVGGYRRIIRFTKWPTLLRRLVYRLTLYTSGRMRAKYFGTFSINSIPAPRTEIMQSVTALTLSLYYGYIEPNGDVLFQVLWDHRVTDGLPIRRMLDELALTLNGEIVVELQAGSQGRALPSASSATDPPSQSPARS
jgi:hypothetical protein